MRRAALARTSLAGLVLIAGVSLACAQGTQTPATEHSQHRPAMPRGTAADHAGEHGQSGMMGGGMAGMMAMMHMMHGAMSVPPLRHVEGQIAFLKAELKITDAQMPQWNAFAAALRGSAARLQQAISGATNAPGPVTAPELMQRRVKLLTAELDAVQTVLAAATPLYAALSDEQKKLADALLAERMMTMQHDQH